MAEAKALSEIFEVPVSTSDDSNSDYERVKLKDVDKSVKTSRVNVPLPYKEPEWSGFPPLGYSFEVIKNGTFVDIVKIETSLIIFGRLDVCNVVFEHPSVSRYHAVIQYCKGDDLHPKGFYLYDLNSTHGTFLNKEQIKPNIYYKLKVGYVLKFGGSTRLHIFQGPEEDEDGDKKNIVKNTADDDICDWGIAEDAEEEEDLAENPFALSTPNEDLYLDDPKKTLRGWFEREGYELEYEVEEKGFKTFVCCIKLPVDNAGEDFLTVEASVSGKKKEAVVACALEACRTLDRLGLLRQSHHESRQRKKKKWEDDDYYDSDEDTFLDRTGAIEKKREMRKKMERKSEVETFQSLEIKYKAVMDEINNIKDRLVVHESDIQSVNNAEGDTLDLYMSSLADSSKTPSDKIERSKLKFRLSEVEKEKCRLEKLLDIARPAKLPPVAKYPGMVGKKLKGKLQLPASKSKETVKQNIEKKSESDENIEEVDSDAETDVTKEKKSNDQNIVSIKCERETSKDRNKSKAYGLVTKDQLENNNFNEAMDVDVKELSSDSTSQKATKRSIGPVMPENIEMKDEVASSDLSKCSRKKAKSKKADNSIDIYMTETAEYSTWMPPSGQSGDGMTHLNAKYGY